MSAPARLARLIDRHTGSDGKHATSVQGLTLVRISAPQPAVAVIYEPSLCVVAQGAKRVLLGDGQFRYDAARYLLAAADVPATAQVISASAQAPYLGLSLVMDPLVVGELIAELGNEEPCPASRALVASPMEPALLDSVVRLVELLDSPRDSAVLAPLVRREITYRLLTGPHGPRLRQLVTGKSQGQRITHVLSWLKDHYSEPLRVDSLSKLAAMSPSALYRCFREVTALSPLQYQKRLRLQEARRLMLGNHVDAAEASFRVGYESPTQFSREYRRLFGAPPHRDIEVLRQRDHAVEIASLPRRRGSDARAA